MSDRIMRRHRIYAALLALMLATSACGNGTPDDPAANSPAIDIAKLDSGNYPTMPTDIDSTRTDDSGAVREAIRIGNATPLLMEIDTRFIFDYHKAFGRVFTPKDSPYFSGAGVESKDFNTVFPGLVAGWYTRGQRRNETMAGRELTAYSIRFSTADQVRTAVDGLADRTPGDTFAIANHPAARTKYTAMTETGYPSMSSWLAHGDMLLYVRVDDPVSMPFDATENADLVKAAFDKLIDSLKDYSPTPLDKIASLPLDVDGLLSRTLPLTKDQMPARGANPSGVYPRQAALHAEQHPNLAKAAFDDAGVDYLAAASAFVYRARDAASTTRLITAIEDQTIDMENYDKVDNPPNLPIAHCYNAKPGVKYASDYPPTCWVPVGRYVAQVSSRNIQDVYQQAAAQYKLLASAG
ncbi:hypothetical protein AB0E01_02410 [Nocardia vinacea]|uniref:DUF7373 family lipoprotein n=1 Tax=Nocardia vinacea TaxID=96468 RepID=UPI0033CAE839